MGLGVEAISDPVAYASPFAKFNDRTKDQLDY
jgi:hypothetical protein